MATMKQDYVYRELRRRGIPQKDAEVMAAIAVRESRLQTDAYGDGGIGGSVGLFQIHLPAWGWKLREWTGSVNRQVWIDWLEDPENNIYAASQVYKLQGLKAWSVYNNGDYKEVLKKYGSTGGSSEKPIIDGGEISSYNPSVWERLRSWWNEFHTGSPTKPVHPKDELDARHWAEDEMEEKGITPTEEWRDMTGDKENAWENSPAGQREEFFTDDLINGMYSALIYSGLIIILILAVAMIFKEATASTVTRSVKEAIS